MAPASTFLMRQLPVAAIIALLCCSTGRGTEFVKLTTFVGNWRGTGTDRALPLLALQNTVCVADVDANVRTMKSSLSCTGEAGLQKDIEIEAAIDGDRITGTLSQKTSLPSIPSTTVTGKVTGYRGVDSAIFDVDVAYLLPKVTVTLQAQGAAAFTLQASMAGAELMNISFSRSVKP